MLNFTNEDIEFIKKNFDDYDSILNANKCNYVLDRLEWLIDRKGFDDYDYNDLGREAQKVYDNVYYNN